MKHYITGEAGSEEWALNFRKVRDAFVADLQRAAQEHGITEFHACEFNKEIDWLFDEKTYTNHRNGGTLADAQTFAENMIDQGMKFAFAIARGKTTPVMWLTAWEYPDRGPAWPKSLKIL